MGRVRAFANGSEFDHWQFHNCEKCKKSTFNDPTIGEGDWPKCEIESALNYAYWDDGTVDQAIYDKMGVNCKEKEAVQ